MRSDWQDRARIRTSSGYDVSKCPSPGPASGNAAGERRRGRPAESSTAHGKVAHLGQMAPQLGAKVRVGDGNQGRPALAQALPVQVDGAELGHDPVDMP